MSQRLMVKMPTRDGRLESVVAMEGPNWFPTVSDEWLLSRLADLDRQVWVEDAESGEVVHVLKDNIGDLREGEVAS